MSRPVVVLAGGTGGAKLARGLQDVVDPSDLVVVANVGDDIEIYGAYVSPDPDLVTFWLADRIDERGWGIRDDTFAVMDGLRELGAETWFALGDRDLAIGLQRAGMLRAGLTLTDAHGQITRSLGVRATVLPASDLPLRTRVMAGDRWWSFQEFMIRGGEAVPVQDVDFRGARAASITPQIREALADARAVIIGPSNPIVSIEPILRVPGIREAIESSPAPVVAVSPLVQGKVLKGPTAAFMQWADRPLNSDGIAMGYEGLIDGLVADEPCKLVPVLEASMLMDTGAARRTLAEQTLAFADDLAGSARGS